MIIGRYIMVQLGLTSDFNHQQLSWNYAVVLTKQPINFLGKYSLVKYNMSEVVIQTAYPDSTKLSTEIMVKILDNTYANVDHEQVTYNATQMNADEINMLLSLLK